MPRPGAARTPGEMEPLDQSLKTRADIGNRFRFPVGMQFQRERGGAMRAARLRLAAEKHDLVAQPLQRLADGEGKRLDAADLGRAGQVERRVGKKDADLHGDGARFGRASDASDHRDRFGQHLLEGNRVDRVAELRGLDRAMKLRRWPDAGRTPPSRSRGRSARKASPSGSRPPRRDDRARCRRREKPARCDCDLRQFDQRQFSGQDLRRASSWWRRCARRGNARCGRRSARWRSRISRPARRPRRAQFSTGQRLISREAPG